MSASVGENNDGSSGQNNNTPTIIGSVIGGLAGLGLIAVGLLIWRRRHKKGILLQQQQRHYQQHPLGIMAGASPLDRESTFYSDTRDWSHQYYVDGLGANESSTGRSGDYYGHSTSNTVSRGEDDIYPSKRSSWWSSLSTSVMKRR